MKQGLAFHSPVHRHGTSSARYVDDGLLANYEWSLGRERYPVIGVRAGLERKQLEVGAAQRHQLVVATLLDSAPDSAAPPPPGRAGRLDRR